MKRSGSSLQCSVRREGGLLAAKPSILLPEQSDTVFHLEIIQCVLLIRQKSKRSKGGWGKNDRVAQDAKRHWWCLLGIHRWELDARDLAISGWTGTGDDDPPQHTPGPAKVGITNTPVIN